MCGRFNNHLPRMHGWSEMLGSWPAVPLSYNVAPSSKIAAFFASDDRQLLGAAMRWGMVPSWAREFTSKYATFNARLESLAEKPTFADAWKMRRRCVIPMAGYYEWRQNEHGEKQPVYISDQETGLLVAAGLYEPWADQLSCTMITKAAITPLKDIHHRMPILLTQQAGQDWLHGDSLKLDATKQQLMAAKSPNVVYWPVSRAVGNPRNDNAKLIDAVDTD
ncbi:SOS response-associated peptidase [Arenicella xantha]|uniref:Abasic site processing protein n=1 Tax=Arenicella xantha TaxID=644221 RepID=A0A395JKS2_9GAMM|nr:SOS response-associated peptidase [Arenicella xantha]RBP49378.1 putative SOS response-associated peptidase YedK [Arenicella xantha]